MRRHRNYLAGAAAVALSLAIPGTAIAGGKQNVEAGFSPQSDATINLPAPPADVGDEFTKHGTVRFHLFETEISPPVTTTATIDIHAPEEYKFNTEGLDQCDPADIEGQNEQTARDVCGDALIGEGTATAAIRTTGQQLAPGKVLLFNGTPSGGGARGAGNPTVLFDSLSPVPGLVIVSEMQQSELPGFGVKFHTLVAESAGGPVPDGTPIVDTDFTLSRDYTDSELIAKAKKLEKKAKKLEKKAKKAEGAEKKKLLKKAKKLRKRAKKLRQQAKKTWIQAKCTDGELTTRVDWTHVGGDPPQTDTDTQQCT